MVLYTFDKEYTSKFYLFLLIKEIVRSKNKVLVITLKCYVIGNILIADQIDIASYIWTSVEICLHTYNVRVCCNCVMCMLQLCHVCVAIVLCV